MRKNGKGRTLFFRLLRILLFFTIFLLFSVIIFPSYFLPKGMTLLDFFQVFLGALILAGVLAAAVFRAWNDFKKKNKR
tara:strand:- start:417 stop:650 length:234 start_codon:yes stop_codon:yes gene_type:complete